MRAHLLVIAPLALSAVACAAAAPNPAVPEQATVVDLRPPPAPPPAGATSKAPGDPSADSGSATSVGSRGTRRWRDKGVTACVMQAFQGLSFPAPEGGTVTVVYPILFKPSASPPPPAPSP